MSLSIGKNIGKFRQLKWTSEKIGGAEKTDTSDEFKTLEYETDQRKEALEKLEASMDTYLKVLSKRKPTAEDKNKTMPIEALGTCMINQSYVIGEDTLYGKCLYLAGQGHEKIAAVQGDFVNNARMGYYSNLERSLLDLKEYQNLRKKLENRRLDLDAKLSKVQKAKREKPELEEEIRTAQVKYDDSLAEASARMVMIAESEEYHAKDLTLLIKSELEYYQKSAEILKPILDKLNELNNSKSFNKKKSMTDLKNNSSSVGRSSPYSDNEYRHYEEEERGRPSRSSSKSRGYYESKSNVRSTLRSKTQERVVPPPPVPRRQDAKKKVKCTFDFESNEDDELTMYVGDIITVTKEIDEGWWIGEIGEGRNKVSGMFPVNYTEPIVEEKETLPNNHDFDDSDPWTVNELPESYSSTSEPYEEPREIEHEEPPAPRLPFRRSNTSQSVPTRNSITNNPPLPSRNNENTSGSNSRPAPAFPSRSTTISNAPPPRPSGPKPGMASSLPKSSTLSAMSSSPRSSPLRNPNNPASAVAASLSSDNNSVNEQCRECDCNEFSANVFKKGTCNNCFHKH